MSNVVGLTAVFEMVDTLRAATRQFAERSRALQQEWSAQTAAETRGFEAAAQKRTALLEEKTRAVEAALEVTREQAQRVFDRRQEWITEAFRRSRKAALERIDQEEGRQKYRLQKRALDAERQRDADAAAATQRLELAQAQLAQIQDRFAGLERAADSAFASAREFRGLLGPNVPAPAQPENVLGPEELLVELGRLAESTDAALRRFGRILPLRVFRLVPVWLACAVVAVLGMVLGALTPSWLPSGWTRQQIAIATVALVGFMALAFLVSKRLARPLAKSIADHLLKARVRLVTCGERAAARYEEDQARSQERWESIRAESDEQWSAAVERSAEQRSAWPKRLELKRDRALKKNQHLRDRVVAALEGERAREAAVIAEGLEAEAREISARRERRLEEIEAVFRAQRTQLEQEWNNRAQPIWERFETANQSAEAQFPGWTEPVWRAWQPGAGAAQIIRFGHLEVDFEKLADAGFSASGLRWPGRPHFTIPLLLEFPDRGSLLFETGKYGAEQALAAMNNVVFRLLAASAPGRVSFTFMDPLGLGQSFAGLMHLADYEETQINSRIWTQSGQIEEKLGELNEHMEKVIQMYLRNEYRSIAEYNAQAGSIAEKYHVLVIAGFPVNFSETAGRRLLNIAATGARCGVFTLIQWDQRHELPHDFVPEEFRKAHIRLTGGENGFNFARPLPGTRVVLDTPPPAGVATEFLRAVGRSAKNSTRVELPFAKVAPDPSEVWTRDTAEEIRIPIGQSGAGKLQNVLLGKGTRQHVLLAGKTGSGKSTLFHVIITNTALWCSPDQVEFYLVDFKKGVEFKCYADQLLPHARVVAIESDREFGLSVLQRVDQELRNRGELYRKANVQELAAFRRARPDLPLPRVLLIIDEFQEFFTEEDRISQSASVLLDRIVRQGRAFGIHVLLGSQTLGGAYTLARATMGQMAVRIALQCNEADAYLIMDESNAAPRLLSRPGEGIYNDMSGAVEGNSPFQTAWLADEQRDVLLRQLRARASETGVHTGAPMVFEGNAPADPSDNKALQALLRHAPVVSPGVARVWLGAPNSIKDATEVRFERAAGSHLLVVGQAEEAMLGVPALGLAALAAQYPPGAVRLILLESTTPGTPERQFLDQVIATLPAPVLRPSRADISEALATVASELRGSAEAPDTFIIIAGLQAFKQLRAEDDFNLGPSDASSAAASFSSILNEGPAHACHLIVTADTYNTVARFLGRKGLSEFHWRVLFQMSPNDSASLVDSPDASKLGLYRALLHNEREGYTEKFRPYALSGTDWPRQLAEAFRDRVASH